CHIADADSGERFAFKILPVIPEMPLRALPSSARRNREFLMVVTVRTAGRKRVAKPEGVLFNGYLVCNVTEGRRAFIRRYHEIRIITVIRQHPLRANHLVSTPVISDGKQCPDVL